MDLAVFSFLKSGYFCDLLWYSVWISYQNSSALLIKVSLVVNITVWKSNFLFASVVSTMFFKTA